MGYLPSSLPVGRQCAAEQTRRELLDTYRRLLPVQRFFMPTWWVLKAMGRQRAAAGVGQGADSGITGRSRHDRN